jgi:Domain of unknown function (DUF4406)
MTKAYLAGPMSGYPQFNFPAFFDAAKQLRAAGFEIVSPAEIDNEDDKGAALTSSDGDPTNRVAMNDKTWGDFLARDVKLIADSGINAIVFLPDWFKSRGARLEATVGLLQPDFFFYRWVRNFRMDAYEALPMQRSEVAHALYEQFLKESGI